MGTILVTGFPGFLGTVLVERLWRRIPAGDTLLCLVQEGFMGEAREKVEWFTNGRAGGRVRLVTGDVTAPDLGLGGAYAAEQARTREIFHLAAVYDLGVARETAMRVNVEGTRHVLAFAAGCSELRRLHHVSTCYVSGRHEGIFREGDLSVSQTFNNHYEESKYVAELLVQQRMAEGLPVTIYRPSIVAGDSRTGRTQKYDGPYYLLQWVLRQPRLAFLPVLGEATRYEVNVVPCDFVVEALDYLSNREETVGKVYQLCDPNPLTVAEMVEVLQEVLGRRLLRLPLPKGVVKRALGLPPLEKVTRIEPEALEYFVHPTRYRCDDTLRALAGGGIACPPLISYVGKLVAFMRENPQL